VAGITPFEPATFRLVAQRLNQQRHRGLAAVSGERQFSHKVRTLFMHCELIFRQTLMYTHYVFVYYMKPPPPANAGRRYVTLVFLLLRHLPFLGIAFPLLAF